MAAAALRRLAGGAFAAALCLAMLAVQPARAQTILRDAEMERALREVAAPVLASAGLPASTRIIVIQDPEPNAFVTDARTIFITTGLLVRLDRPEMLQGVLAHEAAHIANGHLVTRPANMQNARTAATIGLALAAVLAKEAPNVAGAVAIGSYSSAQRVFLGHTRAEEASADQSALRYMARAGSDPQGLVDVLELFEGQELLNVGRQDPYVLSHPLTADRLRAARGFATAYRKDLSGKTDANTAYWYGRSQAKLAAYLGNPKMTLRRLNAAEGSDAELVARAVASHKAHKTDAAIAAADALIARRPDDAYAQELKGWILLETRDFPGAAAAYARAVEIAPREPLFLAGYGRALLAQDTAATNAKALEVLERSRGLDSLNPSMLRDLGLAYARAGQNGMASLATAERYALSGRLKDADIHAKRAAGLLPRGSAGWLRAQDILVAAEAQKKRTSTR